MPSKCPFCRRKYSRSGAYEKHLRTAHASLDIVLASTVQYNNIQTGELLNADASERQDSDYESDPGPAGLEPDAFCPDIALSLMLKSSILPQPVPGNRIILKAPEK